MAKKYEVTVKEKKGSCDTELFEEMAKAGDITSIKLASIVGSTLSILGYAKCHISTDDKDFDINYIDTDAYGLIQSGSEIFINSVERYLGKAKNFRLVEVKTGKGKTYKAVPMLGERTENKEEATKSEELPF